MYNRVTVKDINDRIDAPYYRLEIMKNEAALSEWKEIPLECLVDDTRHHNIADLGSNGDFAFLRTIQYSDTSGLPYLRTQNICDNQLILDDLIFVAQSSVLKVRNSLGIPGDLVVCRKGKVGAAATIPAALPQCCVSENVTRFALASHKIDADYCSSFLNSRQGHLRFAREATGVVQQWINNQKIRKIKIVVPDSTVQAYIGDTYVRT